MGLSTGSLPISHNCPIIPTEDLADDGLSGQLVDFGLAGLSAKHRVETVVDGFALFEGGHLDRGLVELTVGGGSAALLLARAEGSKPAEYGNAAVERSGWLHPTL
jgi:hypothetical protein